MQRNIIQVEYFAVPSFYATPPLPPSQIFVKCDLAFKLILTKKIFSA